MDSTKKLLAAGCYFSIFFAPFLFPIIVYFVITDKLVKHHAKRAFISHIFPLLWVIAVGLVLIFTRHAETWTALTFGGIAVFGLLNVIIYIWNLIKGIKVLASE
ncbi:DUF4870 domain-containing protein [Bacillus sp. 165]|uniref:DUF4870 domain-containing protein n=1 Tax=Bacillus sp. 165 TaxID=1529117 RepID=UPI001ADBC7B3|nr:DUF4870 domain-containing protein [Bacillus sp. 165]MBO9129936.1 DUF4870 domain-containing protein [Bacillus sp. 165]